MSEIDNMIAALEFGMKAVNACWFWQGDKKRSAKVQLTSAIHCASQAIEHRGIKDKTLEDKLQQAETVWKRL